MDTRQGAGGRATETPEDELEPTRNRWTPHWSLLASKTPTCMMPGRYHRGWHLRHGATPHLIPASGRRKEDPAGGGVAVSLAAAPTLTRDTCGEVTSVS